MLTDQDLLDTYLVGYGTNHLTGLQMVAAAALQDALSLAPAPAPAPAPYAPQTT
jgi:hypothetical protein